MNKRHHGIIDIQFFNFSIMHPNTKAEWQFGIRATNGKLVGVVLAYPACISIGGVSTRCIECSIAKMNLLYS